MCSTGIHKGCIHMPTDLASELQISLECSNLQRKNKTKPISVTYYRRNCVSL